jgi:hypothetical protein
MPVGVDQAGDERETSGVDCDYAIWCFNILANPGDFALLNQDILTFDQVRGFAIENPGALEKDSIVCVQLISPSFLKVNQLAIVPNCFISFF